MDNLDTTRRNLNRTAAALISGTSNNDSIINYGSNSTILKLDGGGGNDTIYGFNETSQLSISGENSSVKVGDDVIVSVGNDSIILVDAADIVDDEIVLTKKGSVSVDGKVFSENVVVENDET